MIRQDRPSGPVQVPHCVAVVIMPAEWPNRVIPERRKWRTSVTLTLAMNSVPESGCVVEWY